jgi:hypothetical protein
MANLFVDQGINLALSQVFGNQSFHRDAEGHGTLVQESGKEHGVEKGNLVLILPDEENQYKNRSPKDPFIMICAVPKGYE